jgi:hypothetical protein
MSKEKKHATLDDVLGELEVLSGKNKRYWFRELLGGLLRGIGFFCGGVLGVLLLGWILSFSGLIPGFRQISNQLKNAWTSQASSTLPDSIQNDVR